MTNILNFEELTTPATKKFIYKGVEHEATDITLQQYLDRVKLTQNVTAESPISEQIEVMIQILRDTFPNIPVTEWRNMSFAKLNIIMDFVMKAPDEIAAQAVAAGNAQATENQPS